MRKARPLVRDPSSFRDDRLFVVACDDTYAPKQYFDCFRIARVQVHVVPTTDGTSSAQHVLERLTEVEIEEDDERWMLLDVDHYATGAHLKAFTEAISKARKSGVNVALSKPSFEFWLLLHHVDPTSLTEVKNASDAQTKLREILGEYNKTRLDPAHFQLSLVPSACGRAESLDKRVTGGDIPAENTTRVYRLWQAIVSKSLANQLPPELLILLGK